MAQQLSKWSHRHNRSAYSPKWKKAPRCIGGTITGPKHWPVALLNTTLTSLLLQPSTITWCDRFDRSCVNIDYTEPSIPTEPSLYRIPWWLTLSKAAHFLVEPNHSWWWPFKSFTNRKEPRTSSACTVDLMLVNIQNPAIYVRVAEKTEHIKVLFHTTNPKNQHFATATHKYGWAKCSIPSRTYAAIPRARGILPRHSTAGRPNPGTSNFKTWRMSEAKVSEHNSILYWDEAAARSLRYPHITTQYSTDSRNRKPRARVSLHFQKPKPQASIKNMIEKFHKLFDVHKTLHKRWWG